jgi:transcriptional regulator with XRE-family HTH domain
VVYNIYTIRCGQKGASVSKCCAEFGKYFKECRSKLGKTLREFCKEHGIDHGNLSKIERGLLPPPKGNVLEKYASYLGIKKGTDEWYELYDKAHACRGEVPPEIMSDEELVKKLPVVFRTLNRKKPTPEQLEKLIEILRRS